MRPFRGCLSHRHSPRRSALATPRGHEQQTRSEEGNRAPLRLSRADGAERARAGSATLAIVVRPAAGAARRRQRLAQASSGAGRIRAPGSARPRRGRQGPRIVDEEHAPAGVDHQSRPRAHRGSVEEGVELGLGLDLHVVEGEAPGGDHLRARHVVLHVAVDQINTRLAVDAGQDGRVRQIRVARNGIDDRLVGEELIEITITVPSSEATLNWTRGRPRCNRSLARPSAWRSR